MLLRSLRVSLPPLDGLPPVVAEELVRRALTYPYDPPAGSFVQVGDRSLRSPHNGHMTILARMGVPGLLLWIIVQGSFGFAIADRYYKTRRNGDVKWNGVFLFIAAYWLAFLIDSSFDVFLEGPMGGIWLWCLYGAGIGCATNLSCSSSTK